MYLCILDSKIGKYWSFINLLPFIWFRNSNILAIFLSVQVFNYFDNKLILAIYISVSKYLLGSEIGKYYSIFEIIIYLIQRILVIYV